MADNIDNINNNHNEPDPNYWQSFAELYNSYGDIKPENEFLDGVTNDFDPEVHLSHLSRRKFLALLGVSSAFAGVGCTDYPDKGEIIPYNQRPEGVTLGKPNHYASTFAVGSFPYSVILKTREGRPIKVDGNPDDPINKGKITLQAQASILDLYDPSRLKNPLVKSGDNFKNISWKDADTRVLNALNSNPDKEIAIITHTISSPTFIKLLDEFKAKYPMTKVYSYELFDEEVRNKAFKKSYGEDKYPIIKWDKARVILSLEGDFLYTDGNTIEQTRLFLKNRNPENPKTFSRFYIAEGNYSLTGMNADYRFRIRPDMQNEFLLSLLNEISKSLDYSLEPDVTALYANHSLQEFATKNNLKIQNLRLLVKDLIKHRGESIIYAGKTLDENVHILTNLLNEILGNTVLYDTTQEIASQNLSTPQDWEYLIQSLNNNNVKLIIHYDTNPLYHLPAKYNYKNALKNAPLIVSLTELHNETTNASHLVLPINNYIESWGDYKPRTGIFYTQQPVIAPLYSTRQKEAILLNWLKGNTNYNDTDYLSYIKSNWEQNIYPKANVLVPFERFWNGVLHDGVLQVKDIADIKFAYDKNVISNLNNKKSDNNGFLIGLYESGNLGDGRFANNGWLQELPHPISKVTWDNYAAISEKSANQLGFKTGDFVQISISNRKLSIPIMIQPGLADDFIAVTLGYGRQDSPEVANNVGFNANSLLIDKTSYYQKIDSIKKTNGTYKFATTQEHYSLSSNLTKDIQIKRGIIQEGTLSKFMQDENFLHKNGEGKNPSMYKEFTYNDAKWGMAINLNSCTGCSACVIACNVENNIPIVGKDQVAAGREMMWLRIDRYYEGDPAEPKISNQPMLCQHCDNAPCENVCPVNATNHSPDGLNQMVYNRCVGTRYCSNNCPYKVRRFNFFDFRDHFLSGYYKQPSVSLIQNPEVTVRARGVMEKCTFCVQRIMDERSDAIKENRKVNGNNVKTACQEACPADAIVFGNVNDKNSDIYKYTHSKLGYYVLEELNTNSNVTYLAKLRNVNSEEV